MSQKNNRDGQESKRLSVVALVIIDILATCLALTIFTFFHLVLPRIREEQAFEQTEPLQMAATIATPIPETAEIEVNQEEKPVDGWKFADLTTDEIVVTDSGYSSHDICIQIHSYEEGQGVIKSPYTVADIYVRDVRCLQSYFAGAKYIPTGHGELLLELMEESGAILASNGDYYSMQLGSAVLRNGVLYRYPVADFDVFVLYDDGTVKIIPKKTVRTKSGWDEVFQEAWQAWSFGPSLLDENGVQYTNLRDSLFDVVANRNPRTAIGYYEPGHYCLVVVDGRSKAAPGASIEELASIFEDLGCIQAYNLDGGASSVMAFNGQLITQQSKVRKLPDIILVTEYEGSFAQQIFQSTTEGGQP